MKKVLGILALSLLMFGCGGNKEEAASDENGTMVMWLAPNGTQEEYWKAVTDEWNASGKGMKIEVKGIPVANSTEEAILNSVAAGTLADFSENINPSFAVQLAEMDQLVDIKGLDGYDTLIKDRKMENIMNGWEKDNKNYVFPLYINPILYWWNMDLLAKVGVTEVPTTYEEIYKISADYKKLYPAKDKYVMLSYKGTDWWNRWFDFIGLYYAASNGKAYMDLEKNIVTYNDEAGKEAGQFMETMVKKGYAPIQVANDEYFAGKVMADAKGPWDITYAKNTYPKIFASTKIGPVPVPASKKVDVQPTFSDTKGLVIFKSSKHQKQAWEFIKWVMSQEKYSKLWIEKTGMAPARGDLLELESLKEIYATNPLAATYAKYVPVAIPTALTTKQTEVLQIMTTSFLEPVLYGKAKIDEALKEAETKTNALLSE